MFPDPNIQWRPLPSILDGIDRPPFVLDRGLWSGILALLVLEAPPRRRCYGVQIRCEAYLAVEEMLHSVAADHGTGAAYDGGAYIKETVVIPAKETFEIHHSRRGQARRFLFPGSDFCYETVGFEEPVILEFENVEAAYAWRLDAPN